MPASINRPKEAIVPLSRPDLMTRFRREVQTKSLLVLKGIELPGRFFAVGDGHAADLLFKRLDNGQGVIVLVDHRARYIGPDPAIHQVFGTPPQNGWRPVLVVSPPDAGHVLGAADRLLGLDGEPPMLPAAPPQGQPKPIVVKTDQVVPDGDRAGREGNELDRFGRDLVVEAREGRLQAPLFRDKEIEALVRILSKAGKNAACLVGPPGVGKTAVVEGFAVVIASRRAPETLAKARLLDVNLSFLAAGAMCQNEFEGRVKRLLDVARRDPNTILFFDEMHTIRRAGGDASQMIKSDLGRGRIRCIGATTNAEFRTIEADEALARRFQVVPIPELTPLQTVDVLRTVAPDLQRHHGVSISEELLVQVVDMAVRYVPDRHLPDKALDLLDEACAAAALAHVGDQATTCRE
jgi:hypothetical protein